MRRNTAMEIMFGNLMGESGCGGGDKKIPSANCGLKIEKLPEVPTFPAD